jgi:phosphohistidine phosphatase SixA
MKRMAASRQLLLVFLLAAFGTVITASAQARGLDTPRPSVLALSAPAVDRHPYALCTQVREQASDYAPVQHAMGGPKRIILMRHADKSDDPENEDLSAAGQDRAAKLATYIPQTFGKPDVIIATAHSKHSNRPRETVQPLADALGLKVQHDFENKEFPDLVDEIFNDPDYKNKTVVLCWHHGNLPAIAALLGAPAGSYLDPWPDDAYNVILDFQYDPFSGAPPKVTRIVEPF